MGKWSIPLQCLLLFLINLTFRTNSTVSPIIGYPRVPGGKGLVVPSESHPYVMQINHKVLMSQGKDQYSRTLTSSACTYTLYNTLSKSNTCSFIAVKVNTNWRSTQYKHLSTTFFFGFTLNSAMKFYFRETEVKSHIPFDHTLFLNDPYIDYTFVFHTVA